MRVAMLGWANWSEVNWWGPRRRRRRTCPAQLVPGNLAGLAPGGLRQSACTANIMHRNNACMQMQMGDAARLNPAMNHTEHKLQANG